MTTKDLIEKLKAYPEDAVVNFYYAEGFHSEVQEAIYDPEFEYLPSAGFLEITIR